MALTLIGESTLRSSTILNIFQDLGTILDCKDLLRFWSIDEELYSLQKRLRKINDLLGDAERRSQVELSVEYWMYELKEALGSIKKLVKEMKEHERMEKELATKNQNRSSYLFTFWDISTDYTSHKRALINVLQRVEEVAKEGKELKLKPQTVGESLMPIAEAGVSSMSIAEAGESSMSDSGAAAHPDFGPLLLDVSDVYGRQDMNHRIIESLLSHDNSSNKTCSFVFIEGMKGLGKTTVAMLVYRDPNVEGHFEFRSWALAPLDCNFDVVMRELIESNTNESAFNFTTLALVRRCKSLLRGKRCLLVLNDLQWTPDKTTTKNFLEKIIVLFNYCANGSKILVTTRDVKISMGSDQLFKLEALEDEHSWALFKQRAFISAGDDDLERMGLEITKMCRGVPQAIKYMADLPKETWQKVLDCKERNDWRAMSELKLPTEIETMLCSS